MGSFKIGCLALAFALSSVGCLAHHEAKVQTALLPPPLEDPVRHTGRLWVELGGATWENQCRQPRGRRQVCFVGVRRAAFGALERGLWTTFSDVVLRDGDAVPPGDYLLELDVSLDARAPDADGPGWSAVASGSYRLSRDGKVLAFERVGSRSRPAFAYGSALGVGAGEVVAAVATHVASSLGAVPEERPLRAVPLPAVVAETMLAPSDKARETVPGAAAPTVSAPVTSDEPTAPTPAPSEPGAPSDVVSPPTTPVAAR